MTINYLVFTRSCENVFDTKLSSQKLSKDGKVIGACTGRPEYKGSCLVLPMMLKGKVFQFLALVYFFASVSKGDLIGKVGGFAVTEGKSNAA